MKTNSAFKLSKTAKRALAIIHNPAQRGAWKKCLIEADHAAQQQPRGRTKN
jgi:hypothetical protein